MIMIRALLFLFLNIAMGFLLVTTIKALLFYPRTKKYLGGFHIPLTPALIYRIKGHITKQLYLLLHNFLNDFENADFESKIAQIEQDIYRKVWDKLESLKGIKYVPKFIMSQIQKLFAQIAYEMVHYFIRTFIPYLIEKYNIESYLATLDNKADISILKGYYQRYIHRYLLYFSLTFFFFTGLFNMIIYLIIR